MNKIYLVVLLTFFSIKITAQETAENQLGAWYMYNGSHKLSEKFALQSMGHFRYFELANEHQQTIYRLGLNYKFNNKTNFTFGLSTVSTDTQYKIPSVNSNEFRLYEDLNVKSIWGKFNARHRFRLEHRFFTNDSNADTQHWIRYDFNIKYPLSANVSVYAFDEIFLNFQGETFSQNWFGAGFLFKMSKNSTYKLGYLNVSTSNADFSRLQFGIILNTDFSKKSTPNN